MLRLSAWGRLARLIPILAALFAPAAARAEEQVDLELVLAVDVSGSMDRDEQILQRNGYSEAIRHPEVLDAIRGGLRGRIALTYMEWAGPTAQRVVVPWQVVDGHAAAAAFTARLDAAPLGTMRGTSISGGLATAYTLFDGNGFDGLRSVIDVSGDGPNNMGEPVIPIRDRIVASGIVINGLPITLKPARGYGSIPELDHYYANCVVGGPGSFLVPVADRTQLVEAIRRKLILEIADLGGGAVFVQGTPRTSPDYDCLVGEKQRMQWMDP